MESIRASNLIKAKCLESDKITTTSFVKDAPNITRYSLADLAEGSIRGMDYYIEKIDKDNIQNVLKFLGRFFFRDEPLNQCIELIPEGEDSTCMELEQYCCSASFDNLSMMAVAANGTIIGVQLNGKMEHVIDNEEPEYIKSCTNPKFKKILEILHYVDQNVQASERFKNLNVLEIMILSVDENWRGRGVAKALMEKSLEIAKEKEFHYARADCSSFFSGKLCARLGFETIYELPYDNYLDEEGKPVFSPASPHTSIMTYVKKL